MTISKTDRKINNVDYKQITQSVDPFNQKFKNPNVAAEMNNLKNRLNNLGTEMASGKSTVQIAQDYDTVTVANEKNKKKKQEKNECKG